MNAAAVALGRCHFMQYCNGYDIMNCKQCKHYSFYQHDCKIGLIAMEEDMIYCKRFELYDEDSY